MKILQLIIFKRNMVSADAKKNLADSAPCSDKKRMPAKFHTGTLVLQSRKILYKREEHFLRLCEPLNHRTPLAGIFGNGEIGIEHYPGSETKYKEQGRQPLYMLFREIIDLSMLERMNKRG